MNTGRILKTGVFFLFAFLLFMGSLMCLGPCYFTNSIANLKPPPRILGIIAYIFKFLTVILFLLYFRIPKERRFLKNEKLNSFLLILLIFFVLYVLQSRPSFPISEFLLLIFLYGVFPSPFAVPDFLIIIMLSVLPEIRNFRIRNFTVFWVFILYLSFSFFIGNKYPNDSIFLSQKEFTAKSYKYKKLQLLKYDGYYWLWVKENNKLICYKSGCSGNKFRPSEMTTDRRAVRNFFISNHYHNLGNDLLLITFVLVLLSNFKLKPEKTLLPETEVDNATLSIDDLGFTSTCIVECNEFIKENPDYIIGNAEFNRKCRKTLLEIAVKMFSVIVIVGCSILYFHNRLDFLFLIIPISLFYLIPLLHLITINYGIPDAVEDAQITAKQFYNVSFIMAFVVLIFEFYFIGQVVSAICLLFLIPSYDYFYRFIKNSCELRIYHLSQANRVKYESS